MIPFIHFYAAVVVASTSLVSAHIGKSLLLNEINNTSH
jgi:hypothetical protein